MSADNPVSPKVTNTSLTAALTTLIMYTLGQWSPITALPGIVAGALLVVVTAGVTFAVGWGTRDPQRTPVRHRGEKQQT